MVEPDLRAGWFERPRRKVRPEVGLHRLEFFVEEE